MKTILVTGATAGIGRLAALELARAGHRVLATGRNEAALASLAEEGRGLSLETFRLDLCEPASIEAAVARAREAGGIDVLINNAGYALLSPVAEASDADLRAQFETNVFGLMSITRALLPDMMARRSGRIVNVSSIGGRVTMPFMGAYHATKYAVEALSDALRMELGPFGIDVVLIEPGPIRTEFSTRMIETSAPDARSAWAPALRDYFEVVKRTDGIAPGPAVVVRALRKAVESRRPRARYVAPFYHGLYLPLVTLLPARLVDWAFRQFMGITARKLGSVEASPAPVG